MTMKNLICLSLLIPGFFSFSIFAQTLPKIQPYKVGESLVYEGKFSKTVLRGIAVADFNFTVERAPNNRNYIVRTEANSKGSLPKLLNSKFYQKYESTVDGENLQILKTVKRDEQNERVRDSEAIFDYKDKKVIYIETDPKDTVRAPYVVASPLEPDTQDLVSAIYALRRLPLVVGKTFELKVSDSGLIYKIPVRVTAREEQKSILGKIWCYRVEPEVFGDDRLLGREGSMIFWITDDARRVLVRAQINYTVGRIEIKLKKINDK